MNNKKEDNSSMSSKMKEETLDPELDFEINKKRDLVDNNSIEFDYNSNSKEIKKKNYKSKYNKMNNKPIKNTNIQTKAVFLYKPDMIPPNLSELLNCHIEFKIEKKYINRNNINVKNNKIWGTDAYTHNSDPVCILFHLDIRELLEKVKENDKVFSLIFLVTKSKKNYNSSKRNGIISKKLNNISSLNNLFTFKYFSFRISQPLKLDFCFKIINNLKRQNNKRVKTTPKRTGSKVSTIFCNHIVFNFLNEPAFHYSLENICDKSENSKFNLSFLLENNTYYFYNDNEIYELTKMEELNLNFYKNNLIIEINKIKEPLNSDNEFFYKKKIPLNLNYKELIQNNLELKDLLFGNNYIKIIQKDFVMNNLNSFKIYENSNIENN